MAANEQGFFVGGGEDNVLELVLMVAEFENIPKSTELYKLQRCILWYMNYREFKKELLFLALSTLTPLCPFASFSGIAKLPLHRSSPKEQVPEWAPSQTLQLP